jgi:hypothetical protein
MLFRNAIRLMTRANINANINSGINTDGLVLWLDGKDFSNSLPTTTLTDRSGSGNNAVASGFNYTSASGNDGSEAIAFDGVDDKLDLGMFDLPKSFTIETYINIKSFADTGIFSKWYSEGNVSFLLSNNGYKLTLHLVDAGGNFTSADTGTLSENTWYHCVFTFDEVARTLKTYLNGQSKNSANGNGARTLTRTTNIGYKQDGNNYGNFSLKSFRIYNRALTDTEILQNYNASK